jgi:hypothetical protein
LSQQGRVQRAKGLSGDNWLSNRVFKSYDDLVDRYSPITGIPIARVCQDRLGAPVRRVGEEQQHEPQTVG